MKTSRAVTLVLSIALLAPSSLAAQIQKSVPPAGATTHEVVVGEAYANSGLKHWFLGGGYRDAWTAPIEAAVLNLDTLGGLTPTGTGGDGQTESLKFIAGDGLEYAVRSMDKNATRKLDTLLLGTVAADLVQDQTAQFLPTAALVVDPLLDALGILHPTHRIMVVPDDPRLGEYREEYAGLVGMFTEQPQEREGNEPGFAGSRRISGSGNFFEELEEGRCDRVEARGYLKARLLDVLVGDRDRHERQWRWARYPDGEDCYVWKVIPEDRDQAFVMNDGFMMTVYRLVQPRNIGFREGYPNLKGLTFSGWEVDRRILPELEEAVWRDVVAEMQRELTDTVIEDAVRRLPAPHYERYGPVIAASLKTRRDDLEEAALYFYRLISRKADITGTDRDENALFEHLPGGDLRVSISYTEGPHSDAPYFQRTFHPDETTEVRVFLHGGDDSFEIVGGKSSIKIRAIGGGGDDRFVNASEGGSQHARFYDHRGDNEFEGASRVDEEDYDRVRAHNGVHTYALDWGGMNRFLPALSYDSDVGLYAGVTADFIRNGFRKYPYRTSNAFTFGVGSTGPEFYVGWDARYRDAVWGADMLFHVDYSGLDVLRFAGYGNDTSFDEVTEFYQVEQTEAEVSPALEWTWAAPDREEEDLAFLRPAVRLSVGPVVKYSDAPADENSERFIGMLDPAPVGLGEFGQVGGRLRFEVDKRDSHVYPTSGFQFITSASAYPAIWDVEEAYGEVHGSLSVFLTPGSSRRAPTLALRAGGKNLFGDAFPFTEAAFIGGSANLRGFRSQRFAGDASAFGNAEFRLPVAKYSLFFPSEFGILAAADAARVYFDSDPSDADEWHSAVGGGIWFLFLNRRQSLSITYMSSDEESGVYAKAGFHF